MSGAGHTTHLLFNKMGQLVQAFIIDGHVSTVPKRILDFAYAAFSVVGDVDVGADEIGLIDGDVVTLLEVEAWLCRYHDPALVLE